MLYLEIFSNGDLAWVNHYIPQNEMKDYRSKIREDTLNYLFLCENYQRLMI